MSNINHEFERYWSSALRAVSDKETFAKESVKEFCRQMFIDITVDERRRHHVYKTRISSEHLTTGN